MEGEEFRLTGVKTRWLFLSARGRASDGGALSASCAAIGASAVHTQVPSSVDKTCVPV